MRGQWWVGCSAVQWLACMVCGRAWTCDSTKPCTTARFPNIDQYTPLIFVLSQGTDPMGEFMEFVREHEMDDRVFAISLGQGQGPVAEKAITDAAGTGDWVFLQVSPALSNTAVDPMPCSGAFHF